VFSSGRGRAAETASVAFGCSAIPVRHGWRLRECDHGQRNGLPVAELRASRRDLLDRPYPGGESWRQAVARVGRFPGELPLRWQGQRIPGGRKGGNTATPRLAARASPAPLQRGSPL
jgi:alpha-ribazole phosphatase/probable phosphoglycerate mutase